MTSQSKTVGVSFRVSSEEHALMTHEAKTRNIPLSDVLRERVKSSQREIEMNDALRQLEHRMLRKVFVQICAINGYDKAQAKLANERYKSLMRGDGD